MGTDELKEFKRLQKENEWLRKAVSDLTLDKLTLMVERLWRREGLKVPARQPRKGRRWLNDGSCVWRRPEYRNYVWSYDLVHCRTDYGRVIRTLNILD